MNNRFDPKKLEKLNNPLRLKAVPPEYIWNKLNLKNVRTIVDIGAGTGFFSIPFQKLSGAGSVYACDISEVMIDWMRENIAPEHPEIIPLQIHSENIPLDDSSADLVFMINLHHELEQPLTVLTEARRLLKKGGKIFIADWKKEEMKMGPSISIRCSTDEISAQLTEVGFHNIAVDEGLPNNFLITAEA